MSNVVLTPVRSLVLVTSLVAIAAAASCGGSALPPGDDKKPPEAIATANSIKVFVDAKDGRHLAQFGPVIDTGGKPFESVMGASTPMSGNLPTAHVAGTVDVDGGVKDLGPLTATGLLLGAAVECGWPDIRTVFNGQPGAIDVAPIPWDSDYNAWFVFPGKYEPDPTTGATPTFDGCDDVLFHSEQLLCMADKLAEVAETTRPVVWKKVKFAPAFFGAFRAPWLIPIQRDADKFVARDLAMNVLAHLARLDMTLPRNPDSGDYSLPTGTIDCSDGYTHAIRDPSWALNGWTTRGLFGVAAMQRAPYFPPYDPATPFQSKVITATTVPDIARGRLDFETHILRDAGRLLKQLITESVYADLAGAESKRSNAGDVKKGNELFWGARKSTADGPFNSVAHATRVLFGRWETGAPSTPVYTPTDDAPVPFTDPKCGAYGGIETVAGTDTLPSALGPAFETRWQDKPIVNTGQQLALSLVEGSGIVVKTDGLDTTGMSLVRDGLTAQLQQYAKVSEGATYQSAGAYAGAIKGIVDSVRDDDLRFALDRSLATYRTMTAADAKTAVNDVDGVHLLASSSPLYSSDLVQAGGAVIQGGVPRDDVLHDQMATVAGAQVAAQCPQFQLAGGYGSNTFPTDRVAAFQNSFVLADTLRTRVSRLRDMANDADSSFDAEVVTLAARADSELRAWTGPGRITLKYDPSLKRFGVSLAGMHYEDLGVNPPDHPSSSDLQEAVRQAVVMVYGEPWVADCAAGIRKHCPDDFDTTYVRQATLPQAIPIIPAGSDGHLIGLRFDNVPNVATTPLHSNVSKFAYLVAKRDPVTPTHGRVLAAFAVRDDGGLYTEAVSDYQRKLVNAVFGVPEPFVTSKFDIRAGSLADSASYCVEDVPRDFFVPLENELTTNSNDVEDSWLHYLNLARDAATQADTLGQQLIDQGLGFNENTQAAREQIGTICGDFGAIDDIHTDNGDVQPPDNDSNLAQCMGEEKVDVVFLTDDPSGSASDPQQKLKDLLHCDETDETKQLDPSLCKATATRDLTSAGLGFAKYVEPDTTTTPTTAKCGDAITTAGEANSEAVVKNDVSNVVNQDYATRDQLGAAVGSTKMTVDTDGKWRVTVSGIKIMDSADATYWPRCKAACALLTEDSQGKDYHFADKFSQLFSNVNSDSYAVEGALRDEVEGALWMMGALSGRIPDGLFTLPVPAVNWSEATDSSSGTKFNVGDAAPVAVVYGAGQFDLVGSQYKLSEKTSDQGGQVAEDDRGALGPATAIDSNYAEARTLSNSGPLAPAWVHQVYANAAKLNPAGGNLYLHVMTSNASRTFPELGAPGAWIDKQIQPLHDSCYQTGTTAAKNYLAVKYPTDVRRIAKDKKGKTYMFDDPDPGRRVFLANVEQYENGDFNETFTDHFPYEPPNDSRGSLLYNKDFLGPGAALHGDAGKCCLLYRSQDPDTEWIDPDPQNIATGGAHAQCAWSGGNTGHCNMDQYMFQDHPFYTRQVLLPRATPKEARAQMFVNSHYKETGCQMIQELTRAMALSCVFNGLGTLTPSGSLPPTVSSPGDIVHLEAWVRGQSQRIARQVSKILLRGIPKRVVEARKNGDVGAGALAGDKGEHLLAIEHGLGDVSAGLLDLSLQLDHLADSIEQARIDLKGANLEHQGELNTIAMDRINAWAEIARGVAAAAGGLINSITGSPGDGAYATATGGIDIAAGYLILNKLSEREGIANDKYGNALAQAFQNLKTTTEDHYTTAKTDLEHVRGAADDVDSALVALKSDEDKAKFYAAEGSGADYVTETGPDGTDEVIPFPLNTAHRRINDVTKMRYQAALRNAKYYAYLARLAIEQRIGKRLDEIDEEVGTVGNPHVWADDLCSLTGIDYNNLTQLPAELPDADIGSVASTKFDTDLVAQFADQYIGDYVQKLQDFVEFYNVKYPSHEGDDTTVLSLRDDVIGHQGACVRDSDNLLLFSGDLTASTVAPGGEDPGACDDGGACGAQGATTPEGWERYSCNSNALDAGGTKCLLALPATSLDNFTLPDSLPGVFGGGATWLVDVPGTAFPPPQDIPDGKAPPEAGAPLYRPFPAGSVAQAVQLDAGVSYTLSWWAQARGAYLGYDSNHAAGSPLEGSPPSGSCEAGAQCQETYRVTVLSEDGQVTVAAMTDKGDVGGWSNRREIQLTPNQSGSYWVVFGASASPDPVVTGSVAVADIQLERTPSSGQASAYQDTSDSRLIATGDCPTVTPQAFRDAFTYNCEDGRCFHELRQPFVIDSKSIVDGTSPLAAKFARGNFNFRHMTVAMNVVGTGVIDCTKDPQQSCYGSAYLDTTLTHEAFQTQIVDEKGIPHAFDFGRASLFDAKALAAERYITIPIGSADQSLLDQPQTTKNEFRGRPIDGSYRLRVYDQPSLVWANVEDVQLVLKYRYWSRIQRSN